MIIEEQEMEILIILRLLRVRHAEIMMRTLLSGSASTQPLHKPKSYSCFP